MKKNNNIISQKNLMLKTLVMPSKKNVNGNIFGGWIMSQMDIGGAILAKEISGNKVSTVHVNYITFLQPISSGDLVFCYAKCIKIGNSSMTIQIEMWTKKVSKKNFGAYFCVAKSIFIYVALDLNGKPKNLPNMCII
ncbi:Putative acyl-CoA thioester hydrolase [Buchnera aphidicola (Cinara tujafilina)]|uniref:Acyl-CoA thioester hydrolase n=1 Tax=Buchnera aphidicola (Cinara tujafilina) TaxID=261317 RepID=F7WZA4_9GAMM|nr:acyl-CoA thioester hydrolase YciA [Buchnera aphidicola]AEH39763.1 Putative acyl-CoA thioester hydrolase [Buchnera aphidicola (Cinara tujafilina)]